MFFLQKSNSTLGTAPPLPRERPEDLPTICAYPKDGKPRQALIVLPGGGYHFLAQHEGNRNAEFLAANGYTALCSIIVFLRELSPSAQLSDAAAQSGWSAQCGLASDPP